MPVLVKNNLPLTDDENLATIRVNELFQLGREYGESDKYKNMLSSKNENKKKNTKAQIRIQTKFSYSIRNDGSHLR